MSSAKDEAAVRALYQELMDGWNTGSRESIAAPFAEDGDLIGFDGTHLKGRCEIASFHQPLFDKWLKGTRPRGRGEECVFPDTKRRFDARYRRNRDAREIRTVAIAGLNPDSRCHETWRRVVPRGIPKYEGQAHGP